MHLGRVLYLRQPMRRPSQKGFPQGKKGGPDWRNVQETQTGRAGHDRREEKDCFLLSWEIFLHGQSATRARALAFQQILYSDHQPPALDAGGTKSSHKRAEVREGRDATLPLLGRVCTMGRPCRSSSTSNAGIPNSTSVWFCRV